MMSVVLLMIRGMKMMTFQTLMTERYAKTYLFTEINQKYRFNTKI